MAQFYFGKMTLWDGTLTFHWTTGTYRSLAAGKKAVKAEAIRRSKPGGNAVGQVKDTLSGVRYEVAAIDGRLVRESTTPKGRR